MVHATIGCVRSTAANTTNTISPTELVTKEDAKEAGWVQNFNPKYGEQFKFDILALKISSLQLKTTLKQIAIIRQNRKSSEHRRQANTHYAAEAI